MNVSAGILAFILSIVIAILSTTFLYFLPESTPTILFISFISILFIAGFLIYFSLDYLVFQEVNKLFELIKSLKMKDFKSTKKKIVKNSNPLKKLNTELMSYVSSKEEQVDHLKRLEKFRREFLANVSHELKTPIFSAQGFIHTLLDGAMDDDEVRQRFLEKAARSLDGLDILVKDLLTLSQLEIGEIKMNKSNFDISELVLQVFEQLENKAKQRNISLNMGQFHFKTIVFADKQRISQLLMNLIENAIKYGVENGSVMVYFKLEKQKINIFIKDDGVGISQENLARIFERFYRVDKARSRSDGSTGLGLAIVKHIVNAHQSKIFVSSELGKGTVFSFKLENVNNSVS